MDSDKDPLAKYRARMEEAKAELAQAEAASRAAAADPAKAVTEREGGWLSTIAFFGCVIALGLALLGVSATFVRLSGHDFDDARVTGWATVNRCDRQGPVTNRGFGYWETCRFAVRWDDGTADDRLTSDVLFGSTDIGRDVRVGRLSERGPSMELARQDTPARPWLHWIGIAIGLVGMLPLFVAGLMISLALGRR
ncbi:DUF6346 domain-containing protein [Actinoplanes sp. NPDC049802]|uniref:DUF6346 domain-containing protein n=1 Tax=Actinoplanes sp. NPDC049802 TaxID=3154742 RepID=UPI0034024033